MARVDLHKAVAKLHALANVLHRPLRDVLDSGARVTAISCAKESQPYGTGFEALERGQKAVAADIAKVYKTPGDAWNDISNRGAKAAFWRAYKAGEIDVAQRFLDDFGSHLSGVPMGQFTGGFAHIAARNTTTGRVRLGRPLLIVTNPKALAKYVEQEQSHVGTGKGGWADVVRAIGHSSSGPRGLREEGNITANWITRRGHGYGKAYHGGTEEKPTITIESRIPYASNILNGGSLADAKRIGRERMILNLEAAVRAETKNLRAAA